MVSENTKFLEGTDAGTRKNLKQEEACSEVLDTWRGKDVLWGIGEKSFPGVLLEDQRGLEPSPEAKLLGKRGREKKMKAGGKKKWGIGSGSEEWSS